MLKTLKTALSGRLRSENAWNVDEMGEKICFCSKKVRQSIAFRKIGYNFAVRTVSNDIMSKIFYTSTLII